MDTKHLFAKVTSAFKESNTARTRVACPGIVVVAVSDDLLRLNRPLYVNQRARDLMAKICSRNNGVHLKNMLPLEVANLCFQLQKVLGSQELDADRKEFHLSQTIVTLDRELRIRGFCLPGASRIEQSRIVLVIEDRGPRSARFLHFPKVALSYQKGRRSGLSGLRWHWPESSAPKAIQEC